MQFIIASKYVYNVEVMIIQICYNNRNRNDKGPLSRNKYMMVGQNLSWKKCAISHVNHFVHKISYVGEISISLRQKSKDYFEKKRG